MIEDTEFKSTASAKDDISTVKKKSVSTKESVFNGPCGRCGKRIKDGKVSDGGKVKCPDCGAEV